MKLVVCLFLFSSPFLLMAQSDTAYIASIETHREHYKQEFLEDERAPLQEEDLPYIDFFAPDADYQVEAAFTATPDAEPFDLATYSGITKPYVQYGWIDFELKGTSLRMAVYQSLRLRNLPGLKEYLFLPFKDATNTLTTYGGGRYIDFKISDIREGKVLIDFNKAYNPWCAYSDGYNCPIPPAENHLEPAIEAGEKNFKKEKK
jgi:uncharacterized protein (DUF1684 family)